MAMSPDGQNAIRIFNAAAAIAFVVSLCVHLSQLFYGPHAPVVLFACNLGILFGLAIIATWAHRRSDGEFDSAVAAETIVAFGVLALILGLATAIMPLLSADPAGMRFDAATLRAMGAPFIQGLAAAGVAPVVAVLLRNFSAQHGGTGSTTDEMLELSRAAVRLTGELGRAKAAAAELTQAISASAQATASLGPDLQAHLGDVATATGLIAPTLSASATSLAQALDAGGRDFADTLDQAGRRFVGGIDTARGEIDAIGAAARTGTGEVAALATELGRLRGSAAESTELLDALGGLIDSVERFVAARQAA